MWLAFILNMVRRKTGGPRSDLVESNGIAKKSNEDRAKNGYIMQNGVHKTDDSRHKLFRKLLDLKIKSVKSGVEVTTICSIFRDEFKIVPLKRNNSRFWKLLVIVGIFMSVIAWALFRNASDMDLSEDTCLLETNELVQTIGRPPTDCSICRGLTKVPIERNISPEVFRRKYAYTAVPVLIKEVTQNWTAMDKFSFSFFRNLYTSIDGALQEIENDCQFFPYKTSFETLEDVFEMSMDRASFKSGEKPWYIGWSNCHKEVAKILRQHYERPYFIPTESESSSIDWIFMGGSGLGAFVHLDYVQRPSWQAQIKGTKTWTLIPTPECEHVCHSMNVTVSKGDIIVLDTNQWYHATYIHPGEISITIGSEYD